MKLIATRKEEQNVAAADPWTMVHVGAGLALGLMKVPRRHVLGLSVAYELAEQVFERYEWGQDLLETNGPETFPNAVTDILAMLVGHWLGELWNRTGDPDRRAEV